MRTTKAHRFVMAAWAVGSLLLHGASPLAAQGGPPAKSPRRMAMASINAILGAEPQELDAVMSRAISPAWIDGQGRDAVRKTLEAMRTTLHGASFQGARPISDSSVQMLFRHARGDAELMVSFDSAPPHQLRTITLKEAGAVEPETAGVSAEAWPAMIHDFVDGLAREGKFSGAVAVGRYGVPVYAGAWGLADAETGRTMTVETPINIGSMNKMFTGLALAQLESAGRVAFDDTVGKYLPSYPNASVRSNVTIHQLLTHTSGIPSYWNAAYEAGREEFSSLAGIASTFDQEPLRFPPGTKWEYSNGGPVVAGQILEAVTGGTYYDYIREHIYAPARMRHTDHYLKNDTYANVAVGYEMIVDGVPRHPNTAGLGLVGSPAGGGYSTVMDLVRFAGALSTGELLSPEALATVWSPTRQGADSDRYGYLWGNGTAAGQRWVGHNGGGPGVSADFRYFPESGYVVVVLSNLSEAAMPVSRWLTNVVAQGLAAQPASTGLSGARR